MPKTTVMSASAPLRTHHQSAAQLIVTEARSIAQSGNYSLILPCSAQLADQARRSHDHQLLTIELSDLAQEGPVEALVAMEILVQLKHHSSDSALTRLLYCEDQIVRRHAGWRLGKRRPSAAAVPKLLDMLIIGGIDTMHAHRTLRRWSESASDMILQPAMDRLHRERNPASRARIVDLLGVIGHEAQDELLRLALADAEALCVRAAAIGALGELSGADIDNALNQLAILKEPIAAYADLALNSRESGKLRPTEGARTAGLRLAQLVLVKGLDSQLSLGGRGDTGGVASLLVSLGEALADRHDVDHVLTIGSGSIVDAARGATSSTRLPLSYGTLAIGDPGRETQTPNDTWEHLPAIERGIRHQLELAGPVDVLHLRMADAGTLAGAHVAAAAGIRVCFSAAPDPHNVIESLQARGELDDNSFIELDTQANVWFRARLIEEISRSANQLALFPRSKPMAFLDNIGIDEPRRDQRIAVVAEGIDIKLLNRALAVANNTLSVRQHSEVLDDLTALIPPSRRELPLLVSVGRFNPVKGMDRVVSAWATSESLHDTCNLVIIGGAQGSLGRRWRLCGWRHQRGIWSCRARSNGGRSRRSRTEHGRAIYLCRPR